MVGRIFLSLSFGLFFVVACSDSSSSSEPSPEEACAQVSETLCTKIESCSPAGVKLAYNDVATCIARIKISCVTDLKAQGVTMTGSAIIQCANDIKAGTCDDAFAIGGVASCKVKAGTLVDGAPCGSDWQCAGKNCRTTEGNLCGACSTRGGAGSACEVNGDCEQPLECVAKKCVEEGKAGAPCSETQPCLETLECNNGTCAKGLAAGVACDPLKDACDGLAGLFCHPTTKVCATIGTAAPGQACGLVDGNGVACTARATCKRPAGSPSGTCEAAAADGAKCDDTNGPRCLTPARCVKGVCTLPDTASCK